jgi:hypothetical protein
VISPEKNRAKDFYVCLNDKTQIYNPKASHVHIKAGSHEQWRIRFFTSVRFFTTMKKSDGEIGKFLSQKLDGCKKTDPFFVCLCEPGLSVLEKFSFSIYFF